MTVGSFIKNTLVIIGGFSLFVVVAFYATLFYQLNNNGPGTLDQDDMAFRLVADLFLGSTVEMLDSYSMSGSWAGDNEKGFSARITGMNEESIAQMGGITRGDRLTPTLDSAVEFVTDLLGGGQLSWFPSHEDIVSDKYYVYPLRLELIGQYPDSATLLIIRPADDVAFYGHVKI